MTFQKGQRSGKVTAGLVWALLIVSLGLIRPVSSPALYGGPAAFINRLYIHGLGREVDQAGLNLQVTPLVMGSGNGQSAMNAILLSDEVKAKGWTDEQFVSAVFHSALDREPTAAEYAYYTGQLSAGFTRTQVLAEFCAGADFIGLCHAIGIKAFPGDDFTEAWQPWFSGGTCAGQGAFMFSVSPVNLESISNIEPVGLMVGSHVVPADHAYIGFSPEGTFYPPPHAIYAPGPGYIINIQRLSDTSLDGQAVRTYSLDIEHSCTFYSYFINVNELSARVSAELGRDLAEGESAATRIAVSAGETVALAGSYQAVDFGVIDRSREHYVVNRPRYQGYNVHTLTIQDPFDYFEEPLKSRLQALSTRSAAPLGGQNQNDIPGRLVGNWYLDGSGNVDGRDTPDVPYYYNHLALTYSNSGPQWIVFSFSEHFPLAGQYGVLGNSPDPAEITPASGLVKYELTAQYNWRSGENHDPQANYGTLLVAMLDEQTIKIEQFVGLPKEQVIDFTDGASIFRR